MSILDISSFDHASNKYVCNACGKLYSKMGISTHFWLNHGDGNSHREKLIETCKCLHVSKVGKPAWNSGLTAQSDERVKKSVDTLKEHNKTRRRKKVVLSKETKEKLSLARARVLTEHGRGGFNNVPWFDVIDSFGNQCSLRGSWELRVSKWLSNQSIFWTRKHTISYNDGSINRTYVPDFFIPADNVVLEVKGYFSENDKRKMAYVSEQNKDIVVKMLFGRDISNLDNMSYAEILSG